MTKGLGDSRRYISRSDDLTDDNEHPMAKVYPFQYVLPQKLENEWVYMIFMTTRSTLIDNFTKAYADGEKWQYGVRMPVDYLRNESGNATAEGWDIYINKGQKEWEKYMENPDEYKKAQSKKGAKVPA